MKISIPKLSLVVLIGPSGSGKSTFARKHFLPTEVLSSDACRGMVSDDANNQAVTNEAFALLHYIAAQRLALGRLTVIDATNVQPEARKPLVELARKYHCLPVAIVLNLPEKLCQERNRSRDERNFGPHVIRQQYTQLRRSLRGLAREGFRHVFVLESPEEVEAATVERVPLWNDKRHEHGPFDIVGDVHGCCDELEALLRQFGYVATALEPDSPIWGNLAYTHPEGRKAVFVGDLVDRGPRIVDTVRLVRNMVHCGSALCVPGNHDMKLMRKLRGRNVQVTHGLANSLAEIDALPDDVREPFREELAEFLDGLVSHYVLDDGKLVVAHAGMKAEMQGRGSGKVRDFALYGETTGETDEFGLPVRFHWAAEYRGPALVVYGHTPVPEPDWLNRTVNIDTGCVFGGKLTALRYPEKEFVSVPAARTYCEPARPFLPPERQAPALTAQQAHDEILDAEDVLGKRIIATRLRGCREDPDLLLATSYRRVDVTDPAGQAAGAGWWAELTGRGGEGMVVKPLDFILRSRRGLAQPAVKCRGREYLRIIYGPDYTAEANLSRLGGRGLGHKRPLALGEFAPGVEGLERFVRREPLRRVHECVFGVLALESEPVDPRL